MAQQLQNPFAQDYPETIDHTYETSAQRCRFNRVQGPWAGNLLATGGQDGVIEVWDMEMTNGALVRTFDGHVKAVESLSWSRNGRYLATAAKDWIINIWDLAYTPSNTPDSRAFLEGETPGSSSSTTCPLSDLHYSLTLDAPILNAEFHPQTSRILLASNSVHEGLLVKLYDEDIVPSTSDIIDNQPNQDDSTPHVNRTIRKRRKRHEVLYLQSQTREEAIASAQPGPSTTGTPADTNIDEEMPEQIEYEGVMTPDIDLTGYTEAPAGRVTACSNLTFATFDRSGERLYAGTKDGFLVVYDTRSRWVIKRQRVSTTLIKQIAFDQSGRFIVVNSSDRAVRVLAITPSILSEEEPGDLFADEIIPLHRFQDTIGKTPWNTVGFSGDGEYVMGGAGIKTSHHIYVWDRSTGVLIKVLEGPKDALDDCDWSPTRPMIASCTSAGEINIWQTSTIEAWSAFAPGFEELEENREYIEREDEFDLEDEKEINRRQQAEEDQEVDFLTSKFGFGTNRLASGSDDYWAVNFPDEDNDERFWPHDDLELDLAGQQSPLLYQTIDDQM